MEKALYIAEKPSVAREFAKALKYDMKNHDGYMESKEAVVTWCVGHLVTMSYPEAYDERYRRWSLDTIPFMPAEFKYEVIDSVKKQFLIVSRLLNREDVKRIYVCTDSGREGEYIYRLVEQQAGVSGKERKRVWIDSQTEEEILRGIREAKDLSDYDALADAAYLRAKEDYLMGINFSRALTLKYSQSIKSYLKTDKAVVSVGRVMTCVLGMVVDREREIRDFVKTPFYRIISKMAVDGHPFEGEWRAVKGSRYFESPLLYKENGFLKEEDAKQLLGQLAGEPKEQMILQKLERKKETKKPPLLYNLAELQNDCSKYFKISPDETLRIAQELYEKKLTTYPRTDARVLSSAVAKEIVKNISGLRSYGPAAQAAGWVLQQKKYQGLAKTRYVNDKQITDHYAIIPTGQGLFALKSVSATAAKVYGLIVRRFLGIFYPPAVYERITLVTALKGESFFTSFKARAEEGYHALFKGQHHSQKQDRSQTQNASRQGNPSENETEENENSDSSLIEALLKLKKGAAVEQKELFLKEGETTPPKRYNSGTMILAMENAGQLIEDEELRAQIKGSGIGTSATRAEILKKLIHIKYLSLNKKTQIIMPTLFGEMIYDVVKSSISPLLNPALTASWEKGLTLVAEGNITSGEYMDKLTGFVGRRTEYVKQLNNQQALYRQFQTVSANYKTKSSM